jgi:hypothetical protein
VIRCTASIAIPGGLLWALDFAGILSLKAVLDFTFSWPILLGGAIMAIATFWLIEK